MLASADGCLATPRGASLDAEVVVPPADALARGVLTGAAVAPSAAPLPDFAAAPPPPPAPAASPAAFLPPLVASVFFLDAVGSLADPMAVDASPDPFLVDEVLAESLLPAVDLRKEPGALSALAALVPREAACEPRFVPPPLLPRALPRALEAEDAGLALSVARPSAPKGCAGLALLPAVGAIEQL